MSDIDTSLSVTLSAGHTSDVESCVALWVEACGIRDGYYHAGVAERARSKFDTPVALVIAKGGSDELAGFALATSPDGAANDPAGAVVVGLIAVDPRTQHRGLRARLLSVITSEIAAAGYESAALHVLLENIAAVRLYEAAGWVPFGESYPHSLLNRPMQTYVRDLRTIDSGV